MMASMDEVLCRYRQLRFRRCLELIYSLEGSYDDVENFFVENCKLVCESCISLDENEPVKIFETKEQYYLFFEKVTSLDSNHIPLELRLTVAFNFTYWLLFYTDDEVEEPEEEEYLNLINKGLLTVLGRKVTSVTFSSTTEKILTNLRSLRKLILDVENTTALLVLELAIVVILYVVRVKQTLIRDCLKVVSSFIEEAKHASGNEFSQVKSTALPLFKFGLCGSDTLVSDLKSSVIDYFHILESTFLFMMEDFKGSLKSLQKNIHTSVCSLWNYLVILNSFELGEWNLCSKFLAKMSSLVVNNSLKARLHIAQGKLKCVERRHKEALREFEIALSLSPNCPLIYYYIGQEYGKMGLTDSMVENFEKLVEVFETEDPGEDFQPNFETVLLDWIHPVNELTEVEAHYALAVSYGLNESFRNAAECFEKVLQFLDGQNSESKRRIVELPTYLTILHEASIMNLLLGNLIRAEQISLDAIDVYGVQKPKEKVGKVTWMSKDIEWLERVIQQELLEADLEPKELPNETVYTEDLLLFFSENVIALLILSEIQRIQEIEDYNATLRNIFSIFSKYLAAMQKKEGLDEKEKQVLTLVKALAGKTCVRIANIQAKHGGDTDVEKMFRRALSCNKGDRDALYNYYNYLLKAGKGREALKLWNTFSKEKVAIELDSLQSFSLRYFLTDKITNRELDKIQREIEMTDLKLT